MDARFGYFHMQQATAEERASLGGELAAHIVSVLDSDGAFHSVAYRLVEDLRGLGHDLVSFDESDDFQIWYRRDAVPPRAGLVIAFRTGDVTVEWLE